MSMAKNYSSDNVTAAVEKSSSFAATCSRLSSFLKAKGSLKDLGINANFNVIGKPELSSPATKTATTTIDLLSNMECSVPTTKNNKSMESPPQYVTFDMFCKQEDSTNKSIDMKESKTEQMTVFYDGKVMVYDYISVDKAREMMLAASGASSSFNGKVEKRIHMPTSNSQCEAFESREQVGLDLPIARRASLHKFLAKRKDRETIRVAPYQLHNPNMAVASSSYKFDLNL